MPEALAGDTALTRKAEVAVVDGQDRAVILDLDRPGDPPVVLEGSGQAMWRWLGTPLKVDQLVRVVAAHYGETIETVQPAVLAFVADLVERGLLIVA